MLFVRSNSIENLLPTAKLGTVIAPSCITSSLVTPAILGYGILRTLHTQGNTAADIKRSIVKHSLDVKICRGPDDFVSHSSERTVYGVPLTKAGVRMTSNNSVRKYQHEVRLADWDRGLGWGWQTGLPDCRTPGLLV